MRKYVTCDEQSDCMNCPWAVECYVDDSECGGTSFYGDNDDDYYFDDDYFYGFDE